MLKGFSGLFYQLRAEIVRNGPMMDSTSFHYQLYPLTAHTQRMMRFSGSIDAIAITPLEISDLLYQISKENLSKLKEKSAEVEEEIKNIDQKILPIRLTNLLINKEYRNGNFSKKQLKEKEGFVSLSSEYLKKLLKITTIGQLPIGVASNTIFAAGKLGLDFTVEIGEIFVPLIKAKAKHMHSQGISETLWGLSMFKVQNKEIIQALVNELKDRKIVRYRDVVTSPFNHLEYIPDPEPESYNNAELLRQAAANFTDAEIKKTLESLAESYNH
ncbi:hypothetical protein SteCoe_31271 [Stentor coeruleus]|uniref:Uncharacterized protein n=1 Tax=Stentor coeruleus TaxID=5963 RepID=A0A1R2B1M7_9CILI|nr:hypothetical protein SteCoe_31271 [Stentor coeruleus]